MKENLAPAVKYLKTDVPASCYCSVTDWRFSALLTTQYRHVVCCHCCNYLHCPRVFVRVGRFQYVCVDSSKCPHMSAINSGGTQSAAGPLRSVSDKFGAIMSSHVSLALDARLELYEASYYRYSYSS